jgi:hypothetical protein
MVLAVIGQLAVNVSYIGFLTADDKDERLGFLVIELTVYLVSTVFFLVAVFQIRRALLNHYNLAEPIGLRLSAVMTFFFNILYLQHHFSRIAKWKHTGFLEPQ